MSGTEVFSAADSLVGYIYQCEYALFRALDVDDQAEYIMVETFDDVVAEGKDSPLELLQLKHHDTNKKKFFTDKSVDLWKTIRVWSSLIKDNAIDPGKTSFYLLTTAHASPSAMLVRHLAPKGAREETRDIKAAETLLLQIAKQIEGGTAIDAKKNVEAFIALPNAIRLLMIGNITIVPGAPVIEDLRKKIVKRLRLTGATGENMERLAQSLVGWWCWVLVERIKSKDKKGIDKNLLQEKITDLVSQYVLSSLPIFDQITNPDLNEKNDTTPEIVYFTTDIYWTCKRKNHDCWGIA